MTTVTINKQQHDLTAVIANAIERASDGYVCPPDARIATGPEQARHITIVRYINNQLGTSFGWEKFDPADYLGSLTAIATKYNRRAGVRGMVRKYGHEAAQRIISNHAGREINLK